MSTRVFVYGSLLRGEPNHRLLERAVFAGEARTLPAFRMVSLGAYPAIVAGGATAVVGEVFEVDTATLARLDRLEGHPAFYQRTEIALADGSRAHAYLLPASQGSEIASGCWRTHQRGQRRP